MPGIRDRHTVPRALHRRSLRYSVALPIVIPMLALTGLWGYAANDLVQEALTLRADAETASTAGKPANALAARLQDERRLTAAWQAASTKSARTALDNARSGTDSAIADFREARVGLQSADPAVRDQAENLNEALGKLSQQRSTVNARKVSAPSALRYYSDITAEATGLLAASARTDDGDLARASAATASLADFTELLSREEAQLAGPRPKVAPNPLAENPTEAAERAEFGRYLAVQRQNRAALQPGNLPADAAEAYEQLTETEQWKTLVQAEETAASRPSALTRETDEWQESAGVVGKELRQISSDSLDGVVEGGSGRADRLLLGAAIGTVLALGVLAFAVVLAVRFARSLTGRLSRLQHATGEWAGTTFPQLIAQLDEDERSEPAPQPSPGDYGSDEIAWLAQEIQRQWQTVVETTVQQARGREGAETVFLGLARRTQVLINRMIPKLDKLEREHEDSKLLKDIFAVDHLATRVRRHTENLLILGGALPGRRWSKAVPIYDVLRSAISETEDYSRVEALPAPPVSLVGQAVADVGHLLAELIENGTSFSPPDTRVCVSAEKVAKGLALEVVDRGLGMPTEQYDELNRMLADPPKPDMMTLGEAPRLGLFVVARLANRHGLEVTLQKSAYGGTLAVVLLPGELLEETQSLLSSLVTEARQEPGEREELPAAPAAPAIASASPAHELTSAPDTSFAEPVPAGAGTYASAPSGTSGRTAESNGTRPAPETYSSSEDATPRPHLDQHGGYPAYAGAGLLPSTPGADSPEALGTAPLSPGTLSVPGPGMLDTIGRGISLGSMTMSSPGSGRSPHGAGLHPGPVDTDPSVEDAPMPASRPHPPHSLTGEAEPPGPVTGQAPQETRDQPLASPARLPVRVRGEHLAEPLRQSSQSFPEPEDPTAGMSTPDRAGATMAAIQSGSKRARSSTPAEPDGDPQAETPGHGTGADDSVWKDL
ncbi:nitrate- and nitrite sensing domain-containing protein [Streptomyces ovatisporus]|uniref:histidine kinase n=1 Tax=Streptomyces ovatisporus TaxID=1128682 RepID=A0ABV9A6G8_9ACTN